MIPKMKVYRFTMENGNRVFVNAPTRHLAWLIFRQDLPQYWRIGVEKMGVVQKHPEFPCNSQVAVVQ